MAIVRSGRRSPLRVSSRSGNTLRPVEWVRQHQFDQQVDAPGGPAAFVLVTDVQFETFTRPTVVRVRGRLTLRVIDITLGAQAVTTMGITMVNPNEPPPDPFLERDGNRWLWWGGARLENPPGATSVEFVDGVSWQVFEFDVKSMRKRLVTGSELQLDISVQGAGVISADLAVSTLIKE